MAFPEVCAAVALGMNVHLPPTDTLDLAQDLGSEWIRIDFNWNIAEPQKGQLDWTPFDQVLNAAQARGLKVFATVGYGAAWASVSGDIGNDGPGNDVPDPVEMKRFAKDAAARYADGRVAAWGTWNEPNLGDFFEGTQQQWIDNAFIPTIDGIKEGCPSCMIVGPELATIGDVYADYLEAALTARGPDLDAVSWHIYASFPEDDSQAGKAKDSFYNKLDAHRVLDINGTVVYEGPLSVREVLLANGYANMPVWITETGRQAQVSSPTELEDQRKYVERVLVAKNQREWWHKTFFYELSEEHPNGMWPDIHWGLALRTADPDATFADNFQLKPAFDDLKTCIAAGGGGGAVSTGGTAGPGGAAEAGTGGAAGSAGAGTGGAGAAAGSGAGDPGADDSGCGCQLPSRAPLAPGLSAFLAGAIALFTRRRSLGRRR